MRVTVRVEGEDRDREHEVYLTRTEDTVELEVDGHRYEAQLERDADATLVRLDADGSRPVRVALPEHDQALVDGEPTRFRIASFEPGGAPGEHETLVEGEGRVPAPMPGTLLEVHVEEGDHVDAEQALGVLEAMKMQSTIEAPRSGTVLRVHAEEGDAVEGDAVLFEIGDEA